MDTHGIPRTFLRTHLKSLRPSTTDTCKGWTPERVELVIKQEAARPLRKELFGSYGRGLTNNITRKNLNAIIQRTGAAL